MLNQVLQSPIHMPCQLPKPLKLPGLKAVNALHKVVSTGNDSSSSGYSTETTSADGDDENSYAISPSLPSPTILRFKNVWKPSKPIKPIKPPRSTPRFVEEDIVSPKSNMPNSETTRGLFDIGTRSQITSPAVSVYAEKAVFRKRVVEPDERDDASSSDGMNGVEMTEATKSECLRWHGGLERAGAQVRPGNEEEEAAKVLLSLALTKEYAGNKDADAGIAVCGESKTVKRRASA